MPPADFFISYRRAKSRDKALILHWILEKEFGRNAAFLDLATIEPGQLWANSLKESVRDCKVFLPLIHSDWHKDQDESSGEKLLTQEDDWVRQEIATALREGKTVVPVLIDAAYLYPQGADLKRTIVPRKEWLPSDVRELFERQFFRLRFDDLTPDSLDVFLKHLKIHVPVRSSAVSSAGGESLGGYYPGALKEIFPLPIGLQGAAPSSGVPYIGLRPFRRQDSRLFYGRSREVYELCYKLDRGNQRLLLLDGYSGTGKSSLLQAGLLPRMEAKNWAVAYARREEDKVGGLPALFNFKYQQLADASSPRLIVLDQIEEVATNPITTLPHEVGDLIDHIVNTTELDPTLSVVLSFRSEFATHVRHQLQNHVERPSYGSYTVHTLERHQLLEAIRSVTADSSLNGQGKAFNLRFRPSKTLPETIASRLLENKMRYHIAPLLQVNMELLWSRCVSDDGSVEVTEAALQWLVGTHDALLDHYLTILRKSVSVAEADDQRLLEVLHFYVEDKPSSAVRRDSEFQKRFKQDALATTVLERCKELYLLYSKGSGHKAITRLSHDSLAESIQARYRQLTSDKVARLGSLALENLGREFDQKIYSLLYGDARETIRRMIALGERRPDLSRYFFELTFIWNEAGRHLESKEMLRNWCDSGLLAASARERALAILRQGLECDAIRQLLADTDCDAYRDMRSRYLTPDQTVMLPIEGGAFMMGDSAGDLPSPARPVHAVSISNFLLARVPITWWQYSLYLLANGRDELLEERSPSWGLNGNHPVVDLDRLETMSYCNWLSVQMGYVSVYELDQTHTEVLPYGRTIVGADGFRLPTEAEFEYACRAGSTSKYSFGDNEDSLKDYGWFEQNSRKQTQPVGTKAPNAWGLFDMHGNVWEWCHDWFNENYYSLASGKDPQGPADGSTHVIRGGCWSNNARLCRSAYRGRYDAETRYNFLGFRIARNA